MTNQVRILVVDDSATQRILLESHLKSGGYDIHTAGDGVEALECIQRELPDMVVTDLQMPNMDGLQLVREISEQQIDVPVILTTAAGSEIIAAEALHAGAASYVPKSALATLLLPTVVRILELRKASQPNQQLADCLGSVSIQWHLTNDQSLVPDLIRRVEAILNEFGVYDSSQHMQIAMALDESITNAIVHGNLEINSDLRDIDNGQPYVDEINRRMTLPPYCDRRVLFRIQADRNNATFTIRDQGPGFCVDKVADPTDMANLENVSGRGLLLINAFMDEVSHNEGGKEIVMVKYCDNTADEVST
ncbi:Transcriptional regulatory protein WalR [Planctomycetes bacterium CA13]|uniref:Transcriptional regulatory protein WalR n=1 Tax=Novipirellula herctigrandis TaxID=2527986 RepID=A0A5C5Z6R7_9BACT|nr:Transcriptional regulatory protein WalR [Planctomycetes bacterium CA13]